MIREVRQLLSLAIPLAVGGTFGWACLRFADPVGGLVVFSAGIFGALLWLLIDISRQGRRMRRDLERLLQPPQQDHKTSGE